jgi:uncharacterized coiled-coil protein SlyX
MGKFIEGAGHRMDALEAKVMQQQGIIDVLTRRLNNLELRVHDLDKKGVSGASGFI